MTALFNTLFRLTLSGGAAVLLLLFAWPVTGRFPARWRKLAATCTLLFFLIPFSVPLPSPVQARVEAAVPSPGAVALPVIAPGPQIGEAVQAADARISLLFVWLAGAALIGSFHLISWARFSRAIRRSAGPAGETADNLCRALSSEYGLGHPPCLCRCGQLGTPMVVGIFHPRILLPEDLREDQLPLVLRHELLHCKFGDTFWKLAALAVSSLHWWNPLAYIPGLVLETQCELACDERLALSMDSRQRKVYGAAILDLASRGPVSHCAPFSRKRLLKGRLKTILRAKTSSVGVRAAGAALGVAFIAAGVSASSVIAWALDSPAAVIGGADGPTSLFLTRKEPAERAPASMTGGSPSDFSLLLPDEIGPEKSPLPDSASGAGETGESPSGENTPPLISLSTPVPSAPITAKFMEYYGHTGVDYSAPIGTPILAAAQGTVTEIKRGAAGYGNYLLIDHGNGYRTRYAHCSEISVNPGDKVDLGQQIAAVGQTGNTTGPICRFELWNDGNPVDPTPYLEGLS